MQTYKIPKLINDKLDKINRNFLWGGRGEQKRMHLVSWKMVCLPKDRGGLGLVKMEDMNTAILMKLAWELLIKRNTLWVNMLLAKYSSDNNVLNAKIPSSCSPIWRQIHACIAHLRLGLTWIICNGKTTRFWVDWWVGSGPLINFSTQPIPEDILEFTVSAYIGDDNCWLWSLFQHYLPSRNLAEIASIYCNSFCTLQDSPCWGLSCDGKFTVKSACDLLRPNMPHQSSSWNLAWTLRTRQRIRTFVWLVLHDRILSNEKRFQRHLTDDASCARCSTSTESLLHLLRDCPHSRTIWDNLIYSSDKQRFFQPHLRDWLCENLSQRTALSSQGIPWANVFATTCWKLWSWRCKKVFENQEVNTQRAISWIKQIAEDDMAAWAKIRALEHPGRPKIARNLSWTRPPHGVVKINVDGSAHGNPRLLSCGGVARNCDGNWLFGFTSNLGFGSITVAELWGAYYGLSEALKHGYQCISLACDSKVVVHLLTDHLPEMHPHRSLIDSCRNLIRSFTSCEIRHEYRETNVVADRLANMGHSIPYGIQTFVHPPPSISPFIMFDLAGGTSSRFIVE